MSCHWPLFICDLKKSRRKENTKSCYLNKKPCVSLPQARKIALPVMKCYLLSSYHILERSQSCYMYHFIVSFQKHYQEILLLLFLVYRRGNRSRRDYVPCTLFNRKSWSWDWGPGNLTPGPILWTLTSHYKCSEERRKEELINTHCCNALNYHRYVLKRVWGQALDTQCKFHARALFWAAKIATFLALTLERHSTLANETLTNRPGGGWKGLAYWNLLSSAV